MQFLSSTHTDVGIAKKINQDAFCLKIAKTPKYHIAMAVLCDGMGGLKCGELASAFVVNAFSNWFEDELPAMALQEIDLSKIMQQWRTLALEQGQKIMKYGAAHNISLGTTLSALLIVNSEYVLIQVGDSRIYKNSGGAFEQLTRDHTLVAHEVELHHLTQEQARTDSRRNVLLQCIGASKTIVPDVERGYVNENDVFLLCSDGFRHEITENEMLGVLSSPLLTSEKVMKKSLVDLVELNKARKEKDNITAILIKAIR